MKERNVVVDIGNTKIKAAVFEEDRIIQRVSAVSLEEIYQSLEDPNLHFIFSTVRHNQDEILEVFKSQKTLILTHETPVPLQIDYETPETLGLDRLASAVGAYHLQQNDVLVIDAGTCITYDLITKPGVFRGGVIAPGLNMRMKSMSHFTASLPDISENWLSISERTPGKSTKECLLQGSKQAMIHEMNGFIAQFTEEYPKLSVILTGGDGPCFESKLKAHIFADFNLVLVGLNRILNYNK